MDVALPLLLLHVGLFCICGNYLHDCMVIKLKMDLDESLPVKVQVCVIRTLHLTIAVLSVFQKCFILQFI